MRFAPRWICVISYCGCMSYGVHFSANQLGGLKKVCVTREYALSRLWVMRESTVPPNASCSSAYFVRQKHIPGSIKMNHGLSKIIGAFAVIRPLIPYLI